MQNELQNICCEYLNKFLLQNKHDVNSSLSLMHSHQEKNPFVYAEVNNALNLLMMICFKTTTLC